MKPQQSEAPKNEAPPKKEAPQHEAPTIEAPKKKPSSLTSTYSKERALGSSGMWGREGFGHVETYTNMLI